MTHDNEPLPPNTREDRDDQHAAPEPGLIQELHEHYEEQAQAINQRLERAWQRIEQRAESEQQSWRQTHSPAQPLFSQERPSPMQKPTPFLSAFRRWPSRLVTLAAAALLVALVGGLIAGLVLVHHPGNKTAGGPISTDTPTPAPMNTATPAGTLVPVLWSLKMLDTQHGWAINMPDRVTQSNGAISATFSNEEYVLSTTDGGIHWKDVSPIAPSALAGSGPSADFLSASLAWVYAQPNLFYVTTNGGHTWQHRALPSSVTGSFPFVENYIFINAQDGWLLAGQNEAPGPQTLALFQTTDGGLSWTELQGPGAQGTSQSGALPLNGNVSRLSFLNASTGWVTEQSNIVNGAATMYMTQDGGHTWQPQQLRLPAGLPQAPSAILEPPQFFNDHDGFLPAFLSTAPALRQEVASSPQSGVLGGMIFVTHDGGNTWRSTPPLPTDGLVSFSDVDHGWLAASTSADLWMTSDGGQHWTKLSSGHLSAYSGGGSNSYINLSFVSSQLGWATQNGNSPSAATPLLKTEDGGHTWTQINYSIF